MNGEQSHTMSLTVGDTLHCRWQIDRGDVSIDISGWATRLCHGDRIDAAEFALTASDAGDCTTCVKGSHAAGQIHITREER